MHACFQQHCLLKVGSWSYSEEEVVFTNKYVNYDPDAFQRATELEYAVLSPAPLKVPR